MDFSNSGTTVAYGSNAAYAGTVAGYLPSATEGSYEDLAGAGVGGDMDRAIVAGTGAAVTVASGGGSPTEALAAGSAVAVTTFTLSNSGSGGNGAGGRVICTHFFKRGMIDRDTWRADLEFTARHLSPTTVRGYQYWGIPYVKLMRRSAIAERIMLPIARARAKELAFKLGQRPRGSLGGKLVRAVFEPACFLIGTVVSQKDWTPLWAPGEFGTFANASKARA